MTGFLALLFQGAASQWGVSTIFISTIIIPIVGNAAEHASAIIFAMKNRMEISIGVAIGSSTQIAIFVVRIVVAANRARALDL